MSDAFITAAVRTPIGRAGGVLAEVRPDDLAAAAIRALVERGGIPPERVDDVILGCANQAGEDNRNVARMAALLAGLPVEVPGQTVNRLCGSGLQAVVVGHARHSRRRGRPLRGRWSGEHDAGAQVMLKSARAWDRSPPAVADSTVGWRFVNPRMPAGVDHLAGRDRRAGGADVRDRAAAAGGVRPRESAPRVGRRCRWRVHGEIVPLDVPGAEGARPSPRTRHPEPGSPRKPSPGSSRPSCQMAR